MSRWLENVADVHVLRSEDVGLRAVVVVQQRDATVAVRVVLDRSNGGWNAILVSMEIDDAVALLVATTTMAGSLAAVVVAATGTALLRDERTLWTVGGELGKVRNRLETAAGARWLTCTNTHDQLSNRSIESPSARVTRARLMLARWP